MGGRLRNGVLTVGLIALLSLFGEPHVGASHNPCVEPGLFISNEAVNPGESREVGTIQADVGFGIDEWERVTAVFSIVSTNINTEGQVDPARQSIGLAFMPQSVVVTNPSNSNLATASSKLVLFTSPNLAEGFYDVSVQAEIHCQSSEDENEQIHSGTSELGATFTVEVRSDETDVGEPELPLEVNERAMEGVCTAPGSVLPVFAQGIADPVVFRERGQVRYSQPNDEEITGTSRLAGASSSGVITVIPQTLEGGMNIQLRGPNGRLSGTVPIRIDPVCQINDGEPLTEKRLKQLGAKVPNDLKERATNKDDLLSFVPGELIIDAPVDLARHPAFQTAFGIQAAQRLPGTTLHIAHLKDSSIRNTLDTAKALGGDPSEGSVGFVSTNDIMTLTQQPNDPQASQQDHLEKTNMFQGWESFFPTKGTGTKIAVIDTGIDLQRRNEVVNSDILPNGVNVSVGQQPIAGLLGATSADDRRGHGTKTSSIAAARGNNNRFGSGVAYNATVLGIKVFGNSRFTSRETIGKGIVAAYLLQADVVNISLGCTRCGRARQLRSKRHFGRIIEQLNASFEAQQIAPPVIVAATGNDGEEAVDPPASLANVIAVGSINPDTKQRSDFSNYGRQVDFVAPGEGVPTLQLGGKFGPAGQGTSFATPQVAGLVANMISMTPNLKAAGVDEVRELIKQCFVRDIGGPGHDKETGWGMIYIPEPADVASEECLSFES